MTDDNDDDAVHVTFTWAELGALLGLLNRVAREDRTVAMASAWVKLADAHQANDPPGRAYR